MSTTQNDHQHALYQTKYIHAINMAEANTDAKGQYTKASIPHLLNAARAQKQLSEITSGVSATNHETRAMQLLMEVKQLRQRLGIDPKEVPAESPATPIHETVKKDVPVQTVHPNQLNEQDSAEYELPEGFSIKQFILKPDPSATMEALERVQPNMARKIRSRVEGNQRDRAMFPGLQDLPPSNNLPMPLFLYGPPGSGKSFALKALCNHVKSIYPGDRSIVLNASSTAITSKYVGTTGHILRALFHEAEKHEFSVIIFDEFEMLAASRGADENKVSRTNDLLELMDGVTGRTRVLVVGCTNYPERVDSAVFSRFREQEFIDSPNATAFERYLSEKPERWHFFGRTLEEATPMISALAKSCADKKFSFRNMDTLCTIHLEEMQMKRTYEIYPEGNAALLYRPLLTQADVQECLSRIMSDYDPHREQAFKAFRERHQSTP